MSSIKTKQRAEKCKAECTSSKANEQSLSIYLGSISNCTVLPGLNIESLGSILGENYMLLVGAVDDFKGSFFHPVQLCGS